VKCDVEMNGGSDKNALQPVHEGLSCEIYQGLKTQFESIFHRKDPEVLNMLAFLIERKAKQCPRYL
jgi:hypothetical protein